MGKDEETEELIKIFVTGIKTAEKTEIAVECHAAQAPALRVGIGCLFFKAIPYGINATREMEDVGNFASRQTAEE
ncbi:MAG: hypothetical protein J7M30_06775 [Deltaproteobacteria bacterium]|nr:hypothetical protein [Deltaproteobacteria bacterium]